MDESIDLPVNKTVFSMLSRHGFEMIFNDCVGMSFLGPITDEFMQEMRGNI